MKKQIFILLMSLSSILTLKAQTWSGSSTIDGNIWRNGNIGIGTNTPQNNLHINGTTRIDQALYLNDASNGGGDKWGIYGWGNCLQLTHRKSDWNFDFVGIAIKNNGFVGIGTNTPAYRLHIGCDNNEGILIGNYNDKLGWDGNGSQPGYHIRFAGYRDVVSNYTGAKISALRTNLCCNSLAQGMELVFYVSQLAVADGDANLNEAMRILANSNIGIGTANPQQKLDVNGTIRAREIKVDLNGADFVFENDYKLMPLNELEKFVKEQKHLPEIATAKEMKAIGTDLGNLNSKILQKMEEMTLYMIEQNKKIQALEEKIENLESSSN